MAEEYVIGIDSGTQSTRAILFNLKGEKIASASATHPALMTDERGLIVHDYQDVYQGLCTACQILIEKIKKNLYKSLDKINEILYNILVRLIKKTSTTKGGQNNEHQRIGSQGARTDGSSQRD